jgi:hypothetical protein
MLVLEVNPVSSDIIIISVLTTSAKAHSGRFSQACALLRHSGGTSRKNQCATGTAARCHLLETIMA